MHESLRDVITDQQENNLRKLADYLLTLPDDYPDFEMSDFTSDGSKPNNVTCGTAACAVGHGPNAGISAMPDENSWNNYSERCFIGPWTRPEYSWCFKSGWSGVDNTVHGAAKRIFWLLEKGLPLDAEEQLYGYADLCYEGWTPA